MLPDSGKALPTQQRPSPRHYGKAAVFLASDDAEMITGFDLRVDAGSIARYWIGILAQPSKTTGAGPGTQ